MDAFDNLANNGMSPALDTSGSGNQDSQSLAASASVSATAAAIPIAIQAVLNPDAAGRVVLPAGVSIDDISVSGPDLIITLPNGQVLIVPNGAINIPTIVMDGDTVPASTVAQLLENLEDFNPQAGLRSSGGNFAEAEGVIGDPYAIGNLLPYTELNFPEPEDRELIPALPDEEPTVVIVTPDQPVGSIHATASVDEAGLPARSGETPGSNSAANSETTSGSIVLDVPDGMGSVTINGVVVAGVGQVFATPFGELVITGISDDRIDYSYTLLDNTNANTNPNDVFTIVVTDRDGDTATADLTIAIIDDVPTAIDDFDSVRENGPHVADGNVLVGTGGSDANGTDGVADTQGADGAVVTAIQGGSVGATFATAYGTLTIDAQGNYTYVLNGEAPAVRALSNGQTLTESFDYTITDGDGDTSTATLTITIHGSDDGVTINGLDAAGPELSFDEDDLPVRPGEPKGSDTTPEPVTDGGTFSVSTPDGMGAVVLDSFNGSPISPLVLVNSAGVFTPRSIPTDYGTLNIVSFTPVMSGGTVVGGTFTYSYTLNDNSLDHSVAGQDSFTDSIGVTVTDIDGSTASATIDIAITDDVPEAIDDFKAQETENQPVTIDVLNNDIQGADGVKDSEVVEVDGSLTGTGTLTNNGDGTFTYTPASGETGTVSFQYQITDGDGDTSIATATITLLRDSVPEIRSANNAIVDEDGLTDANADDSPLAPGEVTSTGDESGTGTIVIDFGGDVPSVLNGSLVLNYAAGLDTQLTVDGVPVTFVLDGGDLVGSVGTSEVLRISVTGAVAGPGAGEVTYTYTATLSQAVDQALHDIEDTSILSGISFTATDLDGSPVSGSFDVTIVDDIPEATSEALVPVPEGTTVPGTFDFVAGADGASLTHITTSRLCSTSPAAGPTGSPSATAGNCGSRPTARTSSRQGPPCPASRRSTASSRSPTVTATPRPAPLPSRSPTPTRPRPVRPSQRWMTTASPTATRRATWATSTPTPIMMVAKRPSPARSTVRSAATARAPTGSASAPTPPARSGSRRSPTRWSATC